MVPHPESRAVQVASDDTSPCRPDFPKSPITAGSRTTDDDDVLFVLAETKNRSRRSELHTLTAKKQQASNVISLKIERVKKRGGEGKGLGRHLSAADELRRVTFIHSRSWLVSAR